MKMEKKILTKYDLTKKHVPYQFGGKKYLELEKKMIQEKVEVQIEIPEGALTAIKYNFVQTRSRSTEIVFSKSNRDVESGVVWSNIYTIPISSEKINEFKIVCDNGERFPLMDLTRESTLRMFNTDVLPKGSIVKFSYIDTRFDDEDDYIEVTDQIGFVRVSSIHCIEIMYKEGINVTKIDVTPGDLFGGEYEDEDSRVELNIEILDIESMLKDENK